MTDLDSFEAKAFMLREFLVHTEFRVKLLESNALNDPTMKTEDMEKWHSLLLLARSVNSLFSCIIDEKITRYEHILSGIKRTSTLSHNLQNLIDSKLK